jgi:hypothetical protein
VHDVEQAAVRAVVEIERVALAQLDPGEDGDGFGDQRAARLAPQISVLQDHHVLEGGPDGADIILHRGRNEPGIDGREAAADIDDVNPAAAADWISSNYRALYGGEGFQRESATFGPIRLDIDVVASTAMGTRAHPTNNTSSRRPNLLRSGVDGRVTFVLRRGLNGAIGAAVFPCRASVMPLRHPSKP